jgi:hypothetical protein
MEIAAAADIMAASLALTLPVAEAGVTAPGANGQSVAPALQR